MSNVNETSIDDLITSYETAAQNEREQRDLKYSFALKLAQRSPQIDNCRTTRVRGATRRARIEWPDNMWDQGRLRELWHSAPHLRDQYLAISALRVKAREYEKLLRETGSEEFEQFKSALKAANTGPQSIPKIVIEE